MKFLVLGGGAQGTSAAFDLLQHGDVEGVVVADRDVNCLPPFLERHLRPGAPGRLELMRLDASDHAAVAQAMAGKDAVLCALPYFFNYDMAALALAARAHYSDLGGNTEIVERQRALDGEAVQNRLSVIPDCGLAPGMVNILAQAGIDALEWVDAVRLYVGGLPQHPRPPLNYHIVYSLEGVIDYYMTPSVVLEGGRLVTKQALSDIEEVRFPEPVGTLEAFHTAGGVSTMPYRHQGKIPEMVYKTLRYPGHARIMEAIRELGLFERTPIRVNGQHVAPRDVLIQARHPASHRWRSPRRGGAPGGGARLAGRCSADPPLRRARPLRRGARDHRDDAHHRLLARRHRADAGGRARARVRGAHPGRGGPGGRVHPGIGPARDRGRQERGLLTTGAPGARASSARRPPPPAIRTVSSATSAATRSSPSASMRSQSSLGR